MARAHSKNTLINIRTKESQKELIDRAAKITNKSRSEFMLDSACQAAENVLLNQRLFFADDKAYDQFVSLLESPVEENLGLKKLLKSKGPWEK